MIIKADRMISGQSVLEDGVNSLCIKGDRIVMCGTYEALVAAYPYEEVVVYKDASLMPGMIDLHVHLGFPPKETYKDPLIGTSMRAIFASQRMRDTLKKGVTTIRDSGSADGVGLALKALESDGYIQCPRIVNCLSAISMTGGHGADVMEGGVIEADGVAEIRKAIRLNLKRGADAIKIMSSEGYREAEFDQEELNFAVKESHRLKKKIAIHAGYGDSIQMALEAGFDSIEHGTHLTVDQGKYMKAHDITWVPTILVFHHLYDLMCQNAQNLSALFQDKKAYLKDSVEAYRQNFKAIYDTGVRIATGTDTDCANYEGASPVAQECAYMVKYGLTPLQAIECATKNGADYLGWGDFLGQLKEDYLADIVVVSGNPAEDIECLNDVQAVYKNGQELLKK